MPLFSPKKRKDKRKATEEPSDGRGNPGKKQETSRKSGGPCVVVRSDSTLAHFSAKGKLQVVMATALGADVVTAKRNSRRLLKKAWNRLKLKMLHSVLEQGNPTLLKQVRQKLIIIILLLYIFAQVGRIAQIYPKVTIVPLKTMLLTLKLRT